MLGVTRLGKQLDKKAFEQVDDKKIEPHGDEAIFSLAAGINNLDNVSGSMYNCWRPSITIVEKSAPFC